jgi:hypothetical protein
MPPGTPGREFLKTNKKGNAYDKRNVNEMKKENVNIETPKY